MTAIAVKSRACLASGLLLAAGAGAAQTASPSLTASTSAPALPRIFAGYSQPTIPPSACRMVSAAEVDCKLPGMIAGRYVIESAGSSTAQGPGAIQAMQIVVADRVCGLARDTAGTWSSGRRTFRFDCAITLLSEQPVLVRVLYADEKAVKDPKGPTVDIKPLAWNGVLDVLPFAPKQE